MSLQRKSKISASRKLMLKVSPQLGEHRHRCSPESVRRTTADHSVVLTLCVLFQSLMVAKAKEELEQEMEEKEEQKAKYLEEKAPPIHTSGMSMTDLKVQL